MSVDELGDVPTSPGVYCLFDLDGVAAYAGRTGSSIRSRLKQHFVRQDSSVVSYGRLDIWDISHVDWWATDNDEICEKALIAHFEPYLNNKTVSEVPAESNIEFESPDGKLHLVDEDEMEFRSQPYNRSKQKLEHLIRMIDKIKYAGHSDQTRETTFSHLAILEENLSEFLDIDDSTKQLNLSDSYIDSKDNSD